MGVIIPGGDVVALILAIAIVGAILGAITGVKII